jgi:hypothetical protein
MCDGAREWLLLPCGTPCPTGIHPSFSSFGIIRINKVQALEPRRLQHGG